MGGGRLSGIVRRTARVLVLDGSGRLLLLRFLHDPADPGVGHGWVTPGGGVDGGETLAEAAARELREEIGLTVDPRQLGGAVAFCAGHADLGWAAGLCRDDFFCLRVAGHEVDVGAMEAHERSFHAGHRWWTAQELAGTTDTVYPFGLAGLLAGLLAGRARDEPVELPWHHDDVTAG